MKKKKKNSNNNNNNNIKIIYFSPDFQIGFERNRLYSKLKYLEYTSHKNFEHCKWGDPLYEAYSECKYRFAVKKKLIRVSYKMLFLSDSTFFKLFFHIFAAIIEALILAGHKFLYTLLIECGRLRC